MSQRSRRSTNETVTVPIVSLDAIEHRLCFLAEVLSRNPSLEDHHTDALATMLRDLAIAVFELHSDERTGARLPLGGFDIEARS